jgi:hypothetical protein
MDFENKIGRRRSIPLEAIRLTVARMVSKDCFLPVGTFVYEELVKGMVDELSFHVRAEMTTAVGEGKGVAFPADWWEALKARWAPEWFKKRYPVNFRIVTFRARLAMPKYVLPPDRVGSSYMIVTDELDSDALRFDPICLDREEVTMKAGRVSNVKTYGVKR